jgi:hypothetical protein
MNNVAQDRSPPTSIAQEGRESVSRLRHRLYLASGCTYYLSCPETALPSHPGRARALGLRTVANQSRDTSCPVSRYWREAMLAMAQARSRRSVMPVRAERASAVQRSTPRESSRQRDEPNADGGEPPALPGRARKTFPVTNLGLRTRVPASEKRTVAILNSAGPRVSNFVFGRVRIERGGPDNRHGATIVCGERRVFAWVWFPRPWESRGHFVVDDIPPRVFICDDHLDEHLACYLTELATGRGAA